MQEEDDDLLDHNQQTSLNHKLWESIKWWETKRYIYNIIIGICGLCSLVLIFNSSSFSPKAEIFILSLIYATIANIAYTLGTIIELLSIYYFRSPFTPSTRNFLWLIGLFFSIGITLIIGIIISAMAAPF